MKRCREERLRRRRRKMCGINMVKKITIRNKKENKFNPFTSSQ